MRPTAINSPLFDINNTLDTWYTSFLNLLTESVRKADVKNIFSNIKIITFNYDRCIERYLTQGLHQYYKISLEEAADIVRQLDVMHPYGQVGFLHGHGEGVVRFGDFEGANLAAISGQIKTFAEGLDDEKLVGSIKSAVAEAETLVFLGFAFHKQNLKLITPNKSQVRRVFGTMHDISPSNQGTIKLSIASMFGRKVTGYSSSHVSAEDLQFECQPKTCAGLFEEYSRSLAA